MQEKNVDRAKKSLTAVDHIRSGCLLIIVNLFLMAFCGWGAYAAYVALQLEQNGLTTEGVVIEMEESNGEDGVSWSPVVEFRVDGQAYQFDGGVSSNPPEYKVGDRVAVRYLRSDPGGAQIDSWTERWLMPIILIPAMLLTAVFLNFTLIRAWRRGETS